MRDSPPRTRRAILQRRLLDSLNAYSFGEIQLRMLQEESGPHHIRDIGLRIAAVHRRLDGLEAVLRHDAQSQGIDAGLPLGELHHRLIAATDRRQAANGEYHGIERRFWRRREADRRNAPRQLDGNYAFSASLKQLSGMMDSFVVILSSEADCLSASRPALAQLGYSVDELQAMSLYDLLISTEATTPPAMSEEGASADMTLRCKDTTPITIRARVVHVKLSAGFVHIIQEIA